MGQYFLVVNLDKREFLNPHEFGDGIKLLEFGCSANGTLTGLTILLRRSNETGGGDLQDFNEFTGRWAGDRIVIIGDYDESGLYDEARKSYRDISKEVNKLVKEVC